MARFPLIPLLRHKRFPGQHAHGADLPQIEAAGGFAKQMGRFRGQMAALVEISYSDHCISCLGFA